MTLWEGRLRGTADEVMAFTVSLPFDRRLAADDLAGSRAHVRGLRRAGVLDCCERWRRGLVARAISTLDAGGRTLPVLLRGGQVRRTSVPLL